MDFGLLVASPQMVDPFFGRTVILMCEHNDQGTMGVVINRPLGITIESVLEQLEVKHEQPNSEQVLWGGPVMPEAGFLICRGLSEDPLEDVIRVSDNIVVSSSRIMLEKTTTGKISSPYYLCLGYAGWGPGQLDAEIRRGTWIVLDLDETLVFSTPLTERYDKAIASLGISASQIWMSNPINE